MTRGRWLALAVALVLVAVGIVAGVSAAGHPTSGAASPAAAGTATESDACRKTTAQVHSAAATTVDGPGSRVAVLGDSWTSGYGLTDQQDGYACLLSRAVGWRAAVDGSPARVSPPMRRARASGTPSGWTGSRPTPRWSSSRAG